MDGDFDPSSIRAKGKAILFVNNAIHPGEPCGIDATMLLVKNMLTTSELAKYMEDIVLVFIPFYNIGGGLNRGSYSRANQNGPDAYGFRGNAKNLDLNRDFIKCDSWNARTFNQIFTTWDPDVFIDNHTSNGADYQYTITLITTQHNKLHPTLAKYLQGKLVPTLYGEMEERKWEMTPYVYARTTPDEGIAGFLDLPRYSTGYTTLHHTIGFMPETHMWKPFAGRVKSVYQFMQAMLKTMYRDKAELLQARKEAKELAVQQQEFALNWQLDQSQVDTILFKGYEAKYKPSAITGMERMYYDHEAPFEKSIPYFNYYKTTKSVQKPYAYIIPKAYDEVIDRLKWNGVQVKELRQDTKLPLDMYYIEDYKTRTSPYEGHYLHYNVSTRTEKQTLTYRAGDYVVITDQPINRYIIETLEPEGPDSFFAWNFFDGILMQKEYFSSYVFEELALKFLEEDPSLKAALEKQKQEDEDFAKSARAQLDFIYKRTPHYEPTHKRYPIGRLMEETTLLLVKQILRIRLTKF